MVASLCFFIAQLTFGFFHCYWKFGQVILSDLYQFNLQNLQIQPPDVFYEKTVNLLKVPSCKLYHNKCMIASAQITSTEIFAFIAVLAFKLLSRKSRKTEKSIETAKKQATSYENDKFYGELLQIYKQLECKIFRILLKHLSDHLSVLFQFG